MIVVETSEAKARDDGFFAESNSDGCWVKLTVYESSLMNLTDTPGDVGQGVDAGAPCSCCGGLEIVLQRMPDLVGNYEEGSSALGPAYLKRALDLRTHHGLIQQAELIF